MTGSVKRDINEQAFPTDQQQTHPAQAWDPHSCLPFVGRTLLQQSVFSFHTTETSRVKVRTFGISCSYSTSFVDTWRGVPFYLLTSQLVIGWFLNCWRREFVNRLVSNEILGGWHDCDEEKLGKLAALYILVHSSLYHRWNHHIHRHHLW